MRTLLFVPLALALGACATTPSQLQGTYSAIDPEQAAAQQAPGEAVRWGGKIVDVHTE
jgi:starvation-inducible outer membrane lipoprotein